MKLLEKYRYYAKLSKDEVNIIKNALELLLESYDDDPPYLDVDYRKEQQQEYEVKRLLNDFNNEAPCAF